ncbi:unnamed protein product [Ranitomeya imitator]|uniref:Uncharacterized protein n=1 Tax=Ranitomeya imitator TaxID=111125 RepID=A0ABN9MC01_9NEOB|nr:unnamed protein product [Ranitomeya imitator]
MECLCGFSKLHFYLSTHGDAFVVGYYTQISTLADVPGECDGIPACAEPADGHQPRPRYHLGTEAYMDSALFCVQAQCLLLMTTVAMPVFSRRMDGKSSEGMR